MHIVRSYVKLCIDRRGALAQWHSLACMPTNDHPEGSARSGDGWNRGRGWKEMRTLTTMRWMLASSVLVTLLSHPCLGAIPPAVFAHRQGTPTFVRADSIAQSGREIDPSLFSESDIRTLNIYSTLPEEKGCVRLGPVLRDYPNEAPFSSLQEATHKARLVLVGSVTARAGGFSGSEAGTLLEIEPKEFIKGSVRRPESSYYVFFPAGNFTFQGRPYCATNPQFPEIPNVGDQVLVFVRAPESFEGSFLAIYHGTDIVVMGRDGIVRSSLSLGVAKRSKSIEVLREVRSLVCHRASAKTCRA